MPECAHSKPTFAGRSEHGTTRDGLLFKQAFRAVEKDAKTSTRYESTDPTVCILCKYVYPVWKEHPFRHGGQQGDADISSDLDYGQARFPVETATITHEEGSDLSHGFTMTLQPGHFGEAYHVLMCCLLVRGTGIPVKVTFDKSEDQKRQVFKDMRDLFSWYGIRLYEGDDHPRSKALATQIIAATFRAQNSQAFRFAQHLQLIDMNVHELASSDSYREVEQVELDAKYYRPSFAAKYWLKRYLRLTEQRLPEQPSLPKSDEVGRMAVIHYRCDPSGSSDRTMSLVYLKWVVESIVYANLVCEFAGWENSRVFTHIVLYGDFSASEGPGLISTIMDYMKKAKQSFRSKPRDGEGHLRNVESEIEVLYISRPWEQSSQSQRQCKSRPPHLEQLDENVEKFWKLFRDSEFDKIPLRVKLLGIWVALGERYHPNLCVVGHRCGFIDMAAFVGIPVFYFDRDRDGLTETYRPGELLWSAPAAVPVSRLRDLGGEMCTFISLEILTDRRHDKGGVTHQGFEHDLMAALFMYVCCEVRKGSDTTVGDCLPGWVERNFMMRDAYAGTQEEAERDADHFRDEVPQRIQNGQEWLRRRYLYAANLARGQTPQLRFSEWNSFKSYQTEDADYWGPWQKLLSSDSRLFGNDAENEAYFSSLRKCLELLEKIKSGPFVQKGTG